MASASKPSITSTDFSNVASLRRYLWEIYNFPMLAPDEECMLAKRWREHKDLDALHRIVKSHLRLAVKIARGHRDYGLPLRDLIGAGNVGLMQAAKKFDPDLGFRFATYAIWWIRAAIQEHVLHDWSLVKMGTTAAQKKLFFNLRRLKRKLNVLEEGDLSPENVNKIAQDLDVLKNDVIQMNRRLVNADDSLNVPLRQDADSGEWQDMLPDDTPSQEESLGERQEMGVRSKELVQALNILSPFELKVLKQRRLQEEPATLKDLGEKYEVSTETIRQVEIRALEKLRTAMVPETASIRINEEAAFRPAAREAGIRRDITRTNTQPAASRRVTNHVTAGRLSSNSATLAPSP